ncbi:MAG: hypothetical protein J6W70_06590, partial [Lentisphaeria bacterium]|nr:hypothetical protein [Lentisphaeria bacterium]
FHAHQDDHENDDPVKSSVELQDDQRTGQFTEAGYGVDIVLDIDSPKMSVFFERFFVSCRSPSPKIPLPTT